MNTGKSPYFDAILVELSRYGSNQVNNQRNEYLESKDWVDVILVSLYKGKGIKTVCDRYNSFRIYRYIESTGFHQITEVKQ